MVKIGDPFRLSDLTALAGRANSIPNPAFILFLSSFYNLTPVYDDASGNVWGHREMRDVVIYQDADGTHTGANYAVGDMVYGDYSSSFMVEAVFAVTRGVKALRVISAGVGTYSDPSTVVFSPAGGSGTGLTLAANFENVGWTSAFGFPDFDLSARVGRIGLPYVVLRGANYKEGDYFTVAELPGWTFTADGVDEVGAITKWTILPGNYPASVPETVNAMPAIGGHGSGAAIAACYVLNARPSWLAELSRLRAALAAAIPGTVPTAQTYCSASQRGPAGVGWPKSPYTNSTSYYDNNSSYQEFYYADTGQPETITLSGITGESHPYDAYSYQMTELPQSPNGPYAGTEMACTAIEYRFQIKNPPGATFSGTFSFPVDSGIHYDGLYTPMPDGFTGTTATTPSLSVDSNVGSFSPVNYNDNSTPNNFYKMVCTASGLKDGDYYVRVTGGFMECSFVAVKPGTFGPYGYYKIPYCTIGNSNTESYNGEQPSPLTINGSVTPTIWHGQLTNGIHNSKNIYKIRLPQLDYPPTGFGITTLVRYPIWNGYQMTGSVRWRDYWVGLGKIDSYLNPTFGPVQYFGPGFAPSLTISNGTKGFWVGSTPMANNLKIVTADQMPWNQKRTKFMVGGSVSVNPMLLGDLAPANGRAAQASNSYDQSLTVEGQSEPPVWAASVYFTIGFTILDSNGNLQTAQVSGLSGASAPAWPATVGESTLDGLIVWKCAVVLTPVETWQPQTAYAFGQIVVDKYGNLQMALTEGGGTSGTKEPHWGTTVGAYTTDNGIGWKMVGRQFQLKPATHRLAGIPRYPVYWATETNATLKPPTSSSGLTIWGAYNQWQINYLGGPTNYDAGWQQTSPTDTGGMAFGWWIYSLTINRTGGGEVAGGSALPAQDGKGVRQEIPVVAGCMRNGSFVAFGTLQTGQTYAVMWPVFTSDPLVYQSSERVLVQAVAISSDGTGVSTGAGLSDSNPMAATYVNDACALLDLI